MYLVLNPEMLVNDLILQREILRLRTVKSLGKEQVWDLGQGLVGVYYSFLPHLESLQGLSGTPGCRVHDSY